MKWSWKICTLRGIALKLHATFSLLLAWFLISNLLEGHSLLAAANSILFVLLLFACVVLHELGHALTAQHLGVVTQDITLYPIGGVARMNRIPKEPRQELLISVAGPAVNLALASLLFGILFLMGGGSEAVTPRLFGDELLGRLMWLNVGLAVFNLLPAFPMDGGRILRATLATRMNYAAATSAAAIVGQVMALLFGVIGLLYNPFLLLIAFFVFLGAREEAQDVAMEFPGVTVQQAMLTEFTSLSPRTLLGMAVTHLMESGQQDFPVLEEGKLVGLLSHQAILDGLAAGGPELPVADAMGPARDIVSPDQPLGSAYEVLQQQGAPAVAVMNGDQLLGLLPLRNVGEFLLLQRAMQTCLRRRERQTSGHSTLGEKKGLRPRPFGRRHSSAGY